MGRCVQGTNGVSVGVAVVWEEAGGGVLGCWLLASLQVCVQNACILCVQSFVVRLQPLCVLLFLGGKAARNHRLTDHMSHSKVTEMQRKGMRAGCLPCMQACSG